MSNRDQVVVTVVEEPKQLLLVPCMAVVLLGMLGSSTRKLANAMAIWYQMEKSFRILELKMLILE